MAEGGHHVLDEDGEEQAGEQLNQEEPQPSLSPLLKQTASKNENEDSKIYENLSNKENKEDEPVEEDKIVEAELSKLHEIEKKIDEIPKMDPAEGATTDTIGTDNELQETKSVKRILATACRNSRSSIGSLEYSMDSAIVEEYEEASRLMEEANKRLEADVEFSKHNSHRFIEAFNKRIRSDQERIIDLERELQITFEAAVRFETLYQTQAQHQGTGLSKNQSVNQSSSAMIKPIEIDVKYVTLVEENKCLKEQMKTLREENSLLKTRAQETFNELQHHKKHLSISYTDRKTLQRKLHKQQQQNKVLDQSMTKQTNVWIQSKQQARKLERERQFQRDVSSVSVTGGQERWKAVLVKNNSDKPRKIPVESWASGSPLKSI